MFKKLGIAIVIDEQFEDTLEWAVRLGFSNCQLQLWKMEWLNDERAEWVKECVERAGLEITGLWCGWRGPIRWDFAEGPSILGLVPPEYRAVRMEELLKGAAFARKLGVADVITHVGFVPLNCRDPLYTGLVSSVRYLAEELKRHGQNFLMETGQEPPIVLKRLMEDVGADNLYVNYDPANLMMYGNANPVDGLTILADKIRSIHAKDGSYPTCGRELGQEYPIGKGKVDFPRFFAQLKKANYQGPVSIEYEIEGDSGRKQDILAGKEYLEQVIRSVEGTGA